MKLNELPIWEKPREKLLRDGKDTLSNAELLAILLHTGTASKSAMDLAGEILSMDGGGIRSLAEASPEELGRIDGLGDAKICSVLAAVELGRRIAAAPGPQREDATNSDEIARRYMHSMRHYKKEHFICLMINSRGGIIEEKEISVGDISSTSANPREVFTDAIRRSAGCVLFLHNHPSGDATPSEEDVATTRRLMEAGSILGIPVLDHIVIGDGEYVSMRGIGLM
ncbi:MAG: DNA repair protein RadC [Firmicutes bacterium]|nr:DNA repair protein RadC [Bacillota bacterium]